MELATLVCTTAARVLHHATDQTFHDVLHLGIGEKSAPLVCTVLRTLPLKGKMFVTSHLMAVLQLALEQDSPKLLFEVSETGALQEKSVETQIDVLHLALRYSSTELALYACMTGAFKSIDQKTLQRILRLALDSPFGQFLLLFLLRRGVLRQSSDTVKEEVLRRAAVTGDLQLANLCISSGVLHGSEHWETPTPIDIASERGHSRLERHLRSALDNHKLLNWGERDANTILIRVAGPPGAGKTTLVESFKTSRLRGFFRWESQTDYRDEKFHERTRGIQVTTYEDSEVLCRILDLGGQEDFASANQLFIGQGKIPTINVIVVSLSDESGIEHDMLKWSAFFASRCSPASFQQNQILEESQPGAQPLQPVIVVATRLDSATENEKKKAMDVCNKAVRHFGKSLDFQGGPVFVDARKSWSGGMEAFRQVLADVQKKVLERAPKQAALCNDIQRALPWIRKKVKGPIIARSELPDLVAEGLSSWLYPFDKNVLISRRDVLDAALRQMSDACEILSFSTPELKDKLVIDPPWLLEKVVGVLLSPANFPPPRVSCDEYGRANCQNAVMALEKRFKQDMEQCAITGSESLQMVAQLGICILDGDGSSPLPQDMIITSQLRTSRSLEEVLSAASPATIWFGVELQCDEVPFSVCLMPQLQVHLFNFCLKRYKQKPSLWSEWSCHCPSILRHHWHCGVEARSEGCRYHCKGNATHSP